MERVVSGSRRRWAHRTAGRWGWLASARAMATRCFAPDSWEDTRPPCRTVPPGQQFIHTGADFLFGPAVEFQRESNVPSGPCAASTSYSPGISRPRIYAVR